MSRKSNQAVRLVPGLAVLFLALIVWAPSAQEAKTDAPDIEASSLSISGGAGGGSRGGFRSYLGEWALTVGVPEEDPMRHVMLTFYDIDGKLGATLQSASQAQPQAIPDITVASGALKLRYMASAGESETHMVLIVRTASGGALTGTLSDELGLLVGQPDLTDGVETLGLGLFAATVSGIKGGKIPGRALLDLSGKKVRVTYVGLRSTSDDFKRLAEVKDGDVFEFTSARATKLFTDADLKFGDIVIKTENVGKNYPGVYSLWLKKTGDGWTLVFNHEADIWGTMHDPAADVAEVPLVLSQTDNEQARFQVELEEQGAGGRLRLAWGSQEWTANFSLVQ